MQNYTYQPQTFLYSDDTYTIIIIADKLEIHPILRRQKTD